MKIMKRWIGCPEVLEAEGEPSGWFETTEEECLRHTEEAGYWKLGSVIPCLAQGVIVQTPFALYKVG